MHTSAIRHAAPPVPTFATSDSFATPPNPSPNTHFDTDLDVGLTFDLSNDPPTSVGSSDASNNNDAFAKTLVLNQPISFDPPARFDLDDSPSTSVDFPLGDDPPIDARVQRVQYMHERFPELSNNTVSIDNAGSMVNSARLYLDEGAVDKACELLTFGVEERPQEMRFWLAQFEIYRRAVMPTEFIALAEKFEIFFSSSAEWQKVRSIGHALAPDEPLFKGTGDRSLDYDPARENWLGAFGDDAHATYTTNATNFRQHMLREFSLHDADLTTDPHP